MTAVKLKTILDSVIDELDTLAGSNKLVHIGLIALKWVVDDSGVLEKVAGVLAAKGL